MIPEQIENVKSQYTDKYVTVDPSRPELARFRDVVGQVKTVNMSGRALVEFDDYHLNIGWYDIDLDYLKVVDKPAPKEKPAKAKAAPAKPAAKAKPAADAGEKKLSPLELARMQGAGGGKSENKSQSKPAAKGKPSTADILAAARGGDAKAAAATEKPAKESSESKPAPSKGKMSTADILAAARGDAAPAETPAAASEETAQAASPTKEPAKPAPPAAASEPAKVDRSKMSVADMLAMARAEKSGGAKTEAAEAPAAETAPATEAVDDSSEEPAAAETAAAADVDDSGSADGVVKVDKSSMSVEDMLAYCREKDAS